MLQCTKPRRAVSTFGTLLADALRALPRHHHEWVTSQVQEQGSNRPAGPGVANETFQMGNSCRGQPAHSRSKRIIHLCLLLQKRGVAQRGGASGAGPTAQAPSVPDVNEERCLTFPAEKPARDRGSRPHLSTHFETARGVIWVN